MRRKWEKASIQLHPSIGVDMAGKESLSPFSPERWKAISPYLDQALDKPEDERAAWLADLREQDPALAADLQTLLNEHQVAAREAFLEESPAPAPGSPGLEGRTIGGYTIRRPG